MFETLLTLIDVDRLMAKQYAVDNDLMKKEAFDFMPGIYPTKSFLLMCATAATDRHSERREELHRVLLWAAELND